MTLVRWREINTSEARRRNAREQEDVMGLSTVCRGVVAGIFPSDWLYLKYERVG